MRRLIIDTDPGHDDAFAILLAFASPADLEILGLTTVAGNVPVEKTTVNALKLRELAGAHDVPVYRGCSRPMVNELVTAEYVHGETGLDGPTLPEPTGAVEPQHAVDFMISELLAAEDRSVTVCLLGPMTNMAMALVKDPSVADKVAEFVIMGGSFREGGNVTPTAEFNVYVDPHAAHVVFTSGVPITIMPLDVTHQAQATETRVQAFRSLGTPVGTAVGAMLDFAGKFDITQYGFEGYPLHDPTVIAYLIDPGMFEWREGQISVLMAEGIAHGQTVVDWHGQTAGEPNAKVMLGIDADRYYELVTSRLARL